MAHQPKGNLWNCDLISILIWFPFSVTHLMLVHGHSSALVANNSRNQFHRMKDLFSSCLLFHPPKHSVMTADNRHTINELLAIKMVIHHPNIATCGILSLWVFDILISHQQSGTLSHTLNTDATQFGDTPSIRTAHRHWMVRLSGCLLYRPSSSSRRLVFSGLGRTGVLLLSFILHFVGWGRQN